jgi:tetratricopeptide (TPR) repeat protein
MDVNMKKLSLSAFTLFLTTLSFSQQAYNITDPQEKFNEAKEYFQKEQYNLAYPLLKELQQSIRETDRANNPVMVQEINYYTTVSGLKQNEGRAEKQAREYIDLVRNNARVQMMNFHLAEYYFRKQQFADAADLYEGTNIANLNNREIADAKFHQGYSYFTLQRFAEAKPLLNSIRQIKDDPNYIDAN